LGSSTGTNIVNVGTGTGATTVNIATGTTNAKTIHIGDGAVANTITIGNTTGATGIAENVGTGNYVLTGAAGSNITLGTGVTTGAITVGAPLTTGTITIGGTAETGTITFGSSTGTNIVNVGTGTGATTVNIATGTTNAKTVHIGDGAVANVIAIGSTTGAASLAERVGTGNYSLDGVGASTYTIGASTVGGTIAIGGTAQTGTITLGSSSTTSTVAIAAGAGANAVTIATQGTGAVNIGNSTGKVGIGSAAPFEQLTVPGLVPTAATASFSLGASSNGTIQVCVQGRYAYIVNQTSTTFQIVDVSNSTSPTLVSTTTLTTTPGSIVVQGAYAYIGFFGTNVLQIFDISNPSSPALIGSLPTLGQSDNTGFMYIQGRYLYMPMNSGQRVRIVDVSNPASPVLVSTAFLAVGADPSSIYVQGNFAYVVTRGVGLEAIQAIDVSDPTNPVAGTAVLIGSGSFPNDIFIQGRYAYIACKGNNTLQIFDLKNATTPSFVSSTTVTGTSPFKLYVQGRYAYVINESGNLQVFDVSNPASPVSVGTVTTANTPVGIWVQGRYAYTVAQPGATGQLQIFDMGGAYIQQLETGGIETGTLATRENAAIGNDLDVRGGLTVARGFDATGNSSIAGQLFVPPTLPTAQTSSIATGTTPVDIFIQGVYAYVVNQATPGSMQIYNITNQASPTLLSTTTTDNQPTSITVQGNYAYVTTNVQTLNIFDVSNPKVPTQVSTLGLAHGNPFGVYVQGRFLYYTAGFNSATNIFGVIDISNPSSPVAVGSTLVGNNAVSTVGRRFYVQGRYAYVVSRSSNCFQVIDVIDPARPTVVGTLTVGVSTAIDVYVQGQYAYVATGTGLQVVDVSNPASPTIVGSTVGSGSIAVFVQGRYAYLGNTSDALQIIDISTPTAPVALPGTVSTSSGLEDIFVQGRYVYVTANAAGPGTLQVFDVGGAYIQQFEAGGMKTGTLQTSNNVAIGNDLEVTGGATFGRGFDSTGDSNVYGQLWIPPTTPAVAIGSLATNAEPQCIYVQGRYAYVVSGTGVNTGQLQVFDVSNVSSPILVSTTSLGSTVEGLSIYVTGRYAYIGSLNNTSLHGSISVYDISNPTSPSLTQTMDSGLGNLPNAVYVQGRYLYIALEVGGSTTELQIFDVANPTALLLAGQPTSGSMPQDVYVQGRYAYVVTNNPVLLTFDVSDPTNPPAPTSVATGTAPTAVKVQGRYAYVVNQGSNTLQIFDLKNPGTPVSVATVTTATSPYQVYLQGRYAYVVTNSGSPVINVIDISTPSLPVVVGTVSLGASTNGNPSSIFIEGRYAYVVSSTNTIQIFDMGGAYIQQLEAGGLEVGTLQTRENAIINNDITISGGATIARGFQATGNSSVYAPGGTALALTSTSGQNALATTVGTVNIGAPTSGVALTVNGSATAATDAMVINQSTASTTGHGLSIVGAINTATGSALAVSAGGSNSALTVTGGTGATAVQITGQSGQNALATTNGKVNFGAATTGTTLTVAGNTSATAATITGGSGLSALTLNSSGNIPGGSAVLVVNAALSGNVARFNCQSGSVSLINCPTGTGNTLLLSGGDIVQAVSSGRYKKNIRSIDEAATKLYQLNPVVFDYKPEHGGAQDVPGFIAEEVDPILPSLVYRDNGEIQSLHYQYLHALEVKELQNHQKLLDTYEERLNSQGTIIDNLLNKITELQNQVAALKPAQP
jgi:hypothetical protein